MSVDDADRRVARDVAEYGWHVIGVLRDEEAPPFGYSIGLYKTFDHAEIIILGIEPNGAMSLVNDLGRMVQNGSVFRDGSRTTDLLQGYECAFVEVPADKQGAFVGRAAAFYGDQTFPVLQCVWPDRNHLYPWDPGFEQDLISDQPVLGNAPQNQRAR